MTQTRKLRVVDVARRIVLEVAPEQETEFDFVSPEYFPRAARRARRPSNEPTASVTDLGATVLTTIAMGVTTDVCKYLILASAKNAATLGRSRVRRLLHREKITPETTVPALADEQVELVRRRALAAALEYGLTPDQAEELSTVLVRSWPPP